MGQHPSLKPTPLPSTPRCEKCNARIDPKQGWCGRCGWYPTLEIFLDLQPWDREPTPEERVQQNEPDKLEAWRKLIPVWGWELIGGAVGVLMLSLLARFILPAHGNCRFVWTIGQMIAGGVVLFGAHLACYLYAALENERLSPLDIIARPLTIWFTVGSSLPATFWRVSLAIWGLAAITFAPLVGGFANRDFMDWGGHPARISLVKAISAQAENQSGSVNGLQDVIENAAKEADELAPSDNAKTAQPLLAVDCLILGFDPAGESDFQSLILAAEVDGKLRYVGTVSHGIVPEVRAQLNQRMKKLEQPKPFIPCGVSATWIKPTLTCRVAAKEWSESHKLVRPVFKELLNEISVRQ